VPLVVVYVGWAVLFCISRAARLLLAHCFPWATKGLKTGCRVRPEADTTDGVLQPLESAIVVRWCQSEIRVKEANCSDGRTFKVKTAY